MTKEDLVMFIKNNYCDIEAITLPNVVGSLPPEKRLLKKVQLDELIGKAKAYCGKVFADFLEICVCKGSLPYGKGILWFFWLGEDNWESMYERWKKYEDGPVM